MAFIYPKDQNQIYLPKDFDQRKNDVILKVAHTDDNAVLYWYLNNEYLGTTAEFHEFSIKPKEGVYKITVMDAMGAEVSKEIEIKS
jgi:penicillin-binding protein 1C